MAVWARFFLTSIFLFFIPQSGLSQDIIYDRNSNLEGNINSPQNSRQSIFLPTQVPLEEYTSPIVTKKIAIIEFRNETETGAVNNPTAQVKITSDITRGFINKMNDFKFTMLFSKTDFLFIILLVTFMLR